MNYRAEIDGLRALAVLAVIFAHAGFTMFDGGFIGVDVFFVISGYLITTIILSEYAKGEFSLIRFYERRARRILPALFFVLVCTLPFAWMWLLPTAYEQFSKSLMMATLSVSNIYFLKKTDYFAPDSSEVPLLHTWSLGVEEQFYLLFPLLFLFRLRTSTLFRIILTVALASLVASEVGARYFPSANYYLLPTRIWEILAGSICAFLVHGKTRTENGVLAGAGLSLVIISIFLFDSATRVPSLLAILPVGGTSLFLLYGSQTSILGRVVTLSPLVWIGRISFSAYLWHQPVFAFWRIRSPELPSTLVLWILIGLTLLLSIFSWYLVEQPFRGRKITFSRLIPAAGACVGALVGFGAWGDLKEGLPFRLPPEVKEFVDRTTWSDKCLFQVKDGLPALPNTDCMFNIGSGKTIAIWGDSIAAALSPSLLEDLEDRDIGLVQLTHGFCAPIANVSTAREEGAANCEAFNRRAMDYLAVSNIDTVVLAASWVNFFNSRYMDVDDQEVSGDSISVKLLADNLRETVQNLQATGKQVVIVYPTPRFDKPVMDVMAARIIKGDLSPDFDYSYAAFKANTARANDILNMGLPDDVKKVLPEKIFCDPDSAAGCLFGRDGVAYIADRGHYTRIGAHMVVDRIADELFSTESEIKPVTFSFN